MNVNQGNYFDPLRVRHPDVKLHSLETVWPKKMTSEQVDGAFPYENYLFRPVPGEEPYPLATPPEIPGNASGSRKRKVTQENPVNPGVPQNQTTSSKGQKQQTSTPVRNGGQRFLSPTGVEQLRTPNMNSSSSSRHQMRDMEYFPEAEVAVEPLELPASDNETPRGSVHSWLSTPEGSPQSNRKRSRIEVQKTGSASSSIATDRQESLKRKERDDCDTDSQIEEISSSSEEENSLQRRSRRRLNSSHSRFSSIGTDPEQFQKGTSDQEMQAGVLTSDQEMQAGVSTGEQEIQAGVLTSDQEMQAGVSTGEQEMQAGVLTSDQEMQAGVSTGEQEIQAGVLTGDQEIQAGVSTGDQGMQAVVATHDRGVQADEEKSTNTMRSTLAKVTLFVLVGVFGVLFATQNRGFVPHFSTDVALPPRYPSIFDTEDSDYGLSGLFQPELGQQNTSWSSLSGNIENPSRDIIEDDSLGLLQDLDLDNPPPLGTGNELADCLRRNNC